MSDGAIFKTTEIGDVPTEWDVLRLGDVAAVKYGKANPKKNGHIPVVGSGGVFDWTDEPLTDFSTLVVGRKGTAGQVQLFKQPCWPSDTTFFLDWKAEIDIDFLFGYMSLHPLSGDEAKTTLPSLKRPDLENYPIPLPPLAEQRKIAHVLNTVQRAIAAQDDLIAAAQELKRSLMRRLFTYGPGIEPAPTKETQLHDAPEHWEVISLGHVVEMKYGFQTSIPKQPPENGVKIISTAEIKNEGYLDLSKIRTVEIPNHRLENYLVQQKDILFNWRNAQKHVGKTALVEFSPKESMIYASFIIRLRTTERMHYRFLHYYLTYLRDIGTFFKRSRRAVNQANFNANELGELNIGLPSLDEQHQIAHILQTADAKIAAEQDRKGSLQELFNSLLQALMSGRLRVNELDLKGLVMV